MRRRASSASDGSQGPTTTQSPRALATREKNREAVRKCRQRKRERTEELKQRCDELSKENVRLRMRLELGNEEACQEKLAKGKQLVAEMSRLLKGLDGKLADREKTPQKDALDVVYQQFFERHMELGPDKLASLSFVVKRLHGLIEPDPLTKAYLFILSLEDDCFNEATESSLETGGEKINWWKEFCKELDLSEEQKRQFRLRRLTGQRTKAELFYVAQRAQSMSQAIVDRRQLAQSFVEMMKGFTHAQLAKFVVWVSTDPCGNELLDMLWTELIASIDADLQKERAEQETNDVRAHEVQNLLNAVRLENGSLFKTLFEVGDIQDSFRNARRIFTEDVVLVDPSNGGEYRGLEQVMRYVDKMRRAFTPVRPDGKTSTPSLLNASIASPHNSSGVVVSPQDPLSSSGIKFEEKSLEFAGDKAIGKFHIYGSYHGKLLESSSPSRNHHESIMVECESVVDITFADSSAKIKELVVTTDLLGLFQSLGSKIEVPQPQSDSALPAPSAIDLGESGATTDGHDSNSNSHGDEIVEQMNMNSPRTSEKKRFPFSPDSMDDGEVLEGRALESSSLMQASELDLRKREHILAELRGLFELEDLSEAYRLAGRILADRCVFVDSNMGTDHRGIDECFAYVQRIRSAFPRMRIVQEAFDRDVKQPGDRIRIEWLVDAEYGGKLVSQQTTKPCSLRGTLFLTMDPEQGEIVSHLAMSWNATSLLRELGVQLNDQRATLRRHSSAS